MTTSRDRLRSRFPGVEFYRGSKIPNDRERGEYLASVLARYRGGMANRAAFTATFLFGSDPRYDHLLREILTALQTGKYFR